MVDGRGGSGRRGNHLLYSYSLSSPTPEGRDPFMQPICINGLQER